MFTHKRSAFIDSIKMRYCVSQCTKMILDKIADPFKYTEQKSMILGFPIHSVWNPRMRGKDLPSKWYWLGCLDFMPFNVRFLAKYICVEFSTRSFTNSHFRLVFCFHVNIVINSHYRYSVFKLLYHTFLDFFPFRNFSLYFWTMLEIAGFLE